MAWLSTGEPVHQCNLPDITAWSTGRPDQGFVAHDYEDSHVYAGARYRCDTCEVIYRLTSDGEWERE